MTSYNTAVIPGDGIGLEVITEGIRVLDAAAAVYGFRLEYEFFPWSCHYYQETGRMMPADGLQTLAHFDAMMPWRRVLSPTRRRWT